ncbi:DUF2252 domain-containing protein [Bradyrhizobium sp. Ec3.3]|uniref:DUF2252 domain-containing protein n=1 Tax=Bradyrhizobium sp. Ec3.3 TaxID=189753 RepID=UPI0004866520|nr:DUF2252 domain-containing protein [Bradyrhizobium sp. Ec3.3]
MEHTRHIVEPESSLALPALHIVSPDARIAAGKALRDKVRREQHGRWNSLKGRADPIELLLKSDAGRLKKLIPIRYGRMLQSPFAFYRGSAGIMAADLARVPITGLKVQACGDCHLLNFGGFATPERSIIFDINDFDETSSAPWEWDVKRLVASIVLAARSNGLSDAQGRDCAISSARMYREHMRKFSKMDPLQIWYAETSAADFIASLPKALQKKVRRRIDKAAAHTGSEFEFPKLAGSVGGQIRITDQPPLIFHPDSTASLDAASTLKELFQTYRESLAADRRTLLDRYRLVDVAIKVVGVGSVGRRCWIALMMSEGNDPLFLQFKEAAQSVLEPYAGRSGYSHHGQRVVMGQRLMQPVSDIFLGWTTAPNGRQFYVRQLHDAKIKPLVETFDVEMLDVYAQACGWVLARAHAKASEISATISGYLGGSNEAFDAAMGKFALAYADQAERDYAALKAAVRNGRIAARQGF